MTNWLEVYAVVYRTQSGLSSYPSFGKKTHLINDTQDFFQEEEALFLHLGGSPNPDLDDVRGFSADDVILEADEALDVGQAELGASAPLEEVAVGLALATEVTPGKEAII